MLRNYRLAESLCTLHITMSFLLCQDSQEPSPTPSPSTSRSLTPIGNKSGSSSPSPPPVMESSKSTSEQSYDTRTKEEQKVLVQLWVENFERLESKGAKKIWQRICDEINSRLGCCKTSQKCMKKIKYLIDRY
ncbi:hypothetical protein AWC38_SpisGene19520 [Stylophora pistillata]|uniref:Uncharacterized protein n=1 Tax=Stylophora pistillata TaxID=50429 RepID=A0A2B4RIM3_STYPI|nr:hypothetical protein AWC38_SpisGene19520 [Stylophora pistillata]